MRARIVFANQEAYARIAPGIGVTAAIEGGAGPVKLGSPAKMPNGLHILSHPFKEVDTDWIVAYSDDPEAWIEWETE